jgi:phosphoglycerate dehydrogenase-like enzyme
MTAKQEVRKVAVLDDYQGVALTLADWSSLEGVAAVTVFRDHIEDEEALVRRLEDFDAICVMRERTPMPASLIERLPKLKIIVSTGTQNRSIDMDAVQSRGIQVCATGYSSDPTIEMTWALILGSVRHIVEEAGAVRAGGWQTAVGADLKGRTLGILGLGRIGTRVAEIGRAFGMNVIAWSQNLTEEKAAAAGARLVSKEDLFRQSDVLSIHVILSRRTRGLVGQLELALMKPTARLINTSRGEIVSEDALIAALKNRQIAGAALDVFDQEPLPLNHPYRTLPNVLATPHVGYVSEDLYRVFYTDTVTHLRRWLEQAR